MQATMQATTHSAPISSIQVWTGRVISALAVLFMAFDGVGKVLLLAPVVEASNALGFFDSAILAIGYLQLACLAVYLIPRTATLGAVLQTGYLGGVIAIHVQVGSPASSIIFALALGAFFWVGLALRDARLRAYIFNR